MQNKTDSNPDDLQPLLSPPPVLFAASAWAPEFWPVQALVEAHTHPHTKVDGMLRAVGCFPLYSFGYQGCSVRLKEGTLSWVCPIGHFSGLITEEQ